MTVHFRSLALRPAGTAPAVWTSLASSTVSTVKRSGIDAFVFPYSWTASNQAPALPTHLPHALAYDGDFAAISNEHLRFVLETFNSAAYVRVDGRPLFLVERVGSVSQTRSFITTLRQGAHAIGLGAIYVVLLDAEQVKPETYGIDATVAGPHGRTYPLLTLTDTTDLDAYARAVSTAIVSDVAQAFAANEHSSLLFVELGTTASAALRAHDAGVLQAAAVVPPIPDTTGTVMTASAPPAAPASSAPSLSVVTVVNSDPEATMRTITSVANHTNGLSNLEFAIIDNGSTDATADLLRELGDAVIGVRNDAQKSLTEAWAQGFSATTGEWVLLITNDVVVDEGWFTPLLTALHADPSCNAVSPAIMINGRATPTQPPASGTGVCILVRRNQTNEESSEAKFVAESTARLELSAQVNV